jgi:pyruvate,orthophosphate dikinase
MSARAQSYRRLNHIPDDMGTAVLVQAMAFGNSGPRSGSGVGFTRNPSDGSDALYVDYLSNAQGEDVVAGHRNALGTTELERRLPAVYRQLVDARAVLEHEFADMQDFEFTVEDGRLYMLQARSGKRTPLAALRIAHDLVAEKVIAPEAGAKLLEAVDLDAIEVLEVAAAGAQPIAGGVPASGGVVAGCVVFDPGRVAQYKREGKPIVLVRENAETGDIESLSQAEALVTQHGARTSHAAVVARELGKVCVVGCTGLRIDGGQRSGAFGSVVVKEGEPITVDGSSGAIYRGELQVRRARPEQLLAEVRGWLTAKPRRKPRKAAGMTAAR